MCFLANGIHPNWAAFVKATPKDARKNDTEQVFASKQEAVSKDIERAFGILVKKFHILAHPIGMWHKPEILHTCVVIHGMCIEERIREKGSHVL